MNQQFRLSVLAAALASIYFVANNARAADADVPAVAAPATPADSFASTLDPITVTSARLRDARIDQSPQVRPTVYTIDRKQIEALGRGDATPVYEVLPGLPGLGKE